MKNLVAGVLLIFLLASLSMNQCVCEESSFGPYASITVTVTEDGSGAIDIKSVGTEEDTTWDASAGGSHVYQVAIGNDATIWGESAREVHSVTIDGYTKPANFDTPWDFPVINTSHTIVIVMWGMGG